MPRFRITLSQLTFRFPRPTKAVTALRRGVKHKVRVAGRPIRGSFHRIDAGGPTYLAMAVFCLASNSPNLSGSERRQTLRWLLQNQGESGGFRGRTNKEADACYCFWCGGAIQVSYPSHFPECLL